MGVIATFTVKSTLGYLGVALAIAVGASRGASLGGLLTVESGPGVVGGVVVGGLVGAGIALAGLASQSCFQN